MLRDGHRSGKSRRDEDSEVDVIKRLCALVVLLSVLGCSTSRPEITETSLTDDTPVTGQRVYMEVNSITDNPPMTYSWTASGGTFEQLQDYPQAVYWKAPDSAGRYEIRVVVTDSDGNSTTHAFTLEVEERSLKSDLLPEGASALCLAKQSDSYVGGVWVSVGGAKIRYLNSQTSRESIWEKDFSVMVARQSEATGYYTIWGASAGSRSITMLTSEAASTLSCNTCGAFDVIRALAVDVLNPSVLWVGSDSYLSYFNLESGHWTAYIPVKVYGLSEGPDYVYAATENGIYRLDGGTVPITTQKATAVLAAGGAEGTVVWSVSGGKVFRNAVALSSQPGVVVDSLDEDISGGVWCGKYRWDGSNWTAVEGLESVRIVKSVASTEGLIYLLSDSGVLYRW